MLSIDLDQLEQPLLELLNISAIRKLSTHV